MRVSLIYECHLSGYRRFPNPMSWNQINLQNHPGLIVVRPVIAVKKRPIGRPSSSSSSKTSLPNVPATRLYDTRKTTKEKLQLKPTTVPAPSKKSVTVSGDGEEEVGERLRKEQDAGASKRSALLRFDLDCIFMFILDFYFFRHSLNLTAIYCV